MGGVRIARNADSAIQTGDSKTGVSGIYAEILYPPTHPDPRLRGQVPNNVVIHSYNPEASEMLRQRRAQRLIGRVPCTTGCPVPEIDEAHKLIPYLQQSAGPFDPTALGHPIPQHPPRRPLLHPQPLLTAHGVAGAWVAALVTTRVVTTRVVGRTA